MLWWGGIAATQPVAPDFEDLGEHIDRILDRVDARVALVSPVDRYFDDAVTQVNAFLRLFLPRLADSNTGRHDKIAMEKSGLFPFRQG